MQNLLIYDHIIITCLFDSWKSTMSCMKNVNSHYIEIVYFYLICILYTAFLPFLCNPCGTTLDNNYIVSYHCLFLYKRPKNTQLRVHIFLVICVFRTVLWLVQGNSLTQKSFSKHCIKCSRIFCWSYTQLMGSLPLSRDVAYAIAYRPQSLTLFYLSVFIM